MSSTAKPRPTLLAALALLACGALAPGAAAGQAHSAGQTPRVQAVPRTGEIELDGKLDEPVWQSAPPATDFTQQDPNEGKPATQRTEIRFVYDDEALYIGARMFDSLGAAGVRTRLARRDQDVESDNVMFVFDTYHDHTGRTIIQINPSGVKYDAGQASPYADPSWDPVWAADTGVDSLGWTAELRIPLSQLRFPRDSLQTWGMQIWRYVERLNEVSMWSFWGKNESGGPARFGHLEALRLHGGGGRRVELLPYVVARRSYEDPSEPGSPFEDRGESSMRVGADVKALLTSTLTLDATINPDFGQVEVDPAVVNLSDVETFFEEKRPFFVEGSGIFGFGDFSCFFCSNVSSMSLFYSRRIGRRPQGFVRQPAAFTDLPDASTILAAAKITGRTAGGLQVGLLDAFTRRAEALAISPEGDRFSEEVEPASNYFVGRVKKNYRNGNLTLGLLGTSVLRSFDSDALGDFLPGHAEAVGFDWFNSWKKQTYSFFGNLAFSNVGGDSLSILRLQRSSVRYFQRPDRDHGGNGLFSDRFDPGLTSLRGFGGYARLAKDAGSWLWETAVNFRSPGFEVNDLAFLSRADYVWMNANVLRQWNTPTRRYRRFLFIVGGQQQYNFDGDLTDRQVHGYLGGQFTNYWNWSTFVIVRPELNDDRLTRGGPVVRRASSWNYFVNLSTDSRKKVVLSTNPSVGRNAEGATGYSANLSVRVKPAPNIEVSAGPAFSHNESRAQFVTAFADPAAAEWGGRRVVFSDLSQNTLSMNTRLNWTFTPTLTLELFAQPLVVAGDFDRFKEFAAPRELDKVVYDATQLTPITGADGRVVSYSLDADRDGDEDLRFGNPDFNFRSLRGNAVLRWEYRPGSTLFLVWQQERSVTEPFGDFALGRDGEAVFDGRPNNIFVVKMSYWFGR
ncbi:MAG TPA: DUF5916 domain-containing protein [Longimicrobium sp.]